MASTQTAPLDSCQVIDFGTTVEQLRSAADGGDDNIVADTHARVCAKWVREVLTDIGNGKWVPADAYSVRVSVVPADRTGTDGIYEARQESVEQVDRCRRFVRSVRADISIIG